MAASAGNGILKQTPILLADGLFDYKTIAKQFKDASKEIPKTIALFVYKKIKQYS